MDSPLFPSDASDIEAIVEYLKPRRRISGRRLLRAVLSSRAAPAFSAKERVLLQRLFAASALMRRWRTLLTCVGAEEQENLHALVRQLLSAGWVEVREERDARGWNPVVLRVMEPGALRAAAGLEDLAARAAQLQALRSYRARSPLTATLQQALTKAPAPVQLRRAPWLPSIDTWLAAGRTGPLRAFAYALTGKTTG